MKTASITCNTGEFSLDKKKNNIADTLGKYLNKPSYNNIYRMEKYLVPVVALVLMCAQHVYAMPTSVTQGGAYSRGFKDATCDAALCNGHGYKPSCPSGHSSEYCSNYRDGYAAGWADSTNANSNSNSNVQGSAKGYWTADDTAIPSNMRAYHLFIDGVNPLWGQNGTDNKRDMQLTHDGLRVGLENTNSSKPIVLHKIIVTPSAFNATYDAGFFVVPKSLNESKIMVMLETKYGGTEVGQGPDGATSHINMDLLYTNVHAFRVCVGDRHLKPGTDKWWECLDEQS